VRLHSEAFSLLPKSMMRHGRFRARLTCLWLLFLDPRLLMSNLMTVWPNVSCDTTEMAKAGFVC